MVERAVAGIYRQLMRKPPEDKYSQGPVSILLHAMNSAEAGSAWAAFMDRYSSLILHVTRQFDYEQERASECFLFVCEKLCDDGFRRLLKFNTSGKAKFSTWLTAVVFNLCVDWHRKEFGRVTMLPAISAMPAFDQAVYRLYFEQCEDRQSCQRILQGEFPGMSRQQLADSIARIHGVLTPRQRWRIGARTQRHRSATHTDTERVASPSKGPEERASDAQQLEHLRRAMQQLSAEQRALLLFRYEQGLTLRKIAELLDLGDPYRARREIHAALEKLGQTLPNVHSG